MRGKVTRTVGNGLQHRITPAYAGKRAEAAAAMRFIKDHPRLCGEKPMFQQSLHVHPGSPPPMRGKAPLWL